MRMQPMTKPQLTRLAQTLAQSLNLNAGGNLVFVLGAGHEKDNVEAIRTWIQTTLEDPRFDGSNGLVPALKERLEWRLRAEEWPVNP